MNKADAIIVAAGSGTRFGAAKQFAVLRDMPIYQHSLKTFALHRQINRIVLVLSAEHISHIEKEMVPKFYGKEIEITLGGATRQDSVSNGMQKLEEFEHSDIVLIHDAARPFVNEGLITNVIEATAEHSAALAAIKIVDTLKHSESGLVLGTVPRENLWRAQTPQGVRFYLLKQAMENAHAENYSATDESELLERIGIKPFLVQGSEDNIKITYESDLKKFSHN
jgi:2-C-methyl-D-erythritol 4-phosphate cytidylyltransferase